MNDQDFLQTAIKHLPGGLILIDLDGRIRAVNQTAETLLALNGPVTAGLEMEVALSSHPRIIKALKEACRARKEANRQELVTSAPDGERMVLGYGILVIRSPRGTEIGVGMTFQDITRMIPLMDSHRFLDIALKNLPGGLIFVDLQGKLRGINQTALRILGMTEEPEPGVECHKALSAHPHVYKVILGACESMQSENRKELTTRLGSGETLTLGYGTIILRNPQNQPIGVGLTFQDITRYIPLPLQTEFVRVIDRFFTPFAAAMVLAAIGLGYAEKWIQNLSLWIVAGLVLFNQVTLVYARKRQDWAVRISYLRQAGNFLANIVLVYLLGTFWGPMWLLFVLTPVATALHASWKSTAAVAMGSAGTLLGIYAVRGLSGPVGWGQAALHASFIVFLSLFVNAIARMVMQIKAAPARTGAVPEDRRPGSCVAEPSSHKLAA